MKNHDARANLLAHYIRTDELSLVLKTYSKSDLPMLKKALDIAREDDRKTHVKKIGAAIRRLEKE